MLKMLRDLFYGDLAKGQNNYSSLFFCDLCSSWMLRRGVEISFSLRSLKSHYWFSSCRRTLAS